RPDSEVRPGLRQLWCKLRVRGTGFMRCRRRTPHCRTGGSVKGTSMFALRMLAVPIVLASIGTAFADDVTDALDQARKAYQAGDFATAKQSADLASQLIGQKNAEGFAALLPAALSGWTAGKAETTSLGSVGFGVT